MELDRSARMPCAVSLMPRTGRLLSVQVRRRLPRRLGWRNRYVCIADQLRRLRIWLIALAALPITVLILRIGLALTDRDGLLAGWFLPLLAASLFCGAVGACIGLLTVPIYRASHRRRLRNSLRYHHRGVSLRSFISKWDNPAQAIYRSCRLSARLAKVHDLQFFATIGCFAAAGSFAALVRSDYFVGEILCLLSVIAIVSKWPTTQRLVRWCGQVIDPLCTRRDEYIEY